MSTPDLSKLLKSKREEAGLTQLEIASALGYRTSQFVSNWERGVSRPPVSDLRKLATLLKISAQLLLELTLQQVEEQICRDFRLGRRR